MIINMLKLFLNIHVTEHTKYRRLNIVNVLCQMWASHMLGVNTMC